MTRWNVVVSALLLCVPSVAQAQGRVPLSQLLPSLVTSAATLAVPHPDDPGRSFVPPLTPRPGDENTFNFVTALPRNPNPGALNAALGLQVAGFPTVTVWSGAPGTGAGHTTPPDFMAPPSASAFSDRATTLGAGRFTIGFGHQGTSFGAVDGLELNDGLRFYFEYADCCPGNSPLGSAVERDLLEETLQIDVHRDVYAFVANMGIGDRVDVGALVPLVKVNLEGRVTSRILRTATAADPQLNRFDLLESQMRSCPVDPNPDFPILCVAGRGAASGLGDIQVHGKVRVVDAPGGGLAITGGVRLPTGDEEELLGTGKVGGRVGAVYSARSGRFGPHVSGGYTRYAGSSGERPPDELMVVGGTDIAVVRRFGVTGEVMYRQLLNAPRVESGSVTFANRGPGPLPSANVTLPDNITVSGASESLQQLLAVVGGRLLIIENWALHSDLMIPLRDDGVTPRFSFVAGLHYSF